MGVREIDRSLEQWQMGEKNLRRRMILAPTPRERERCCSWPRVGRQRARRRPWKEILTPSDGGPRPLGRVLRQP